MSATTSKAKSTAATFKHEKLDLEAREIRVLRIQPRQTFRQPIACELKHIVLPDDSTTKGHDGLSSVFTTLSYTWGKPSTVAPRSVLINGQNFQVRQNLHDFLDRASRSRSRVDEWIWIDQICIDQGNSKERNHQVAQMARIYQASTRTYVWLGTGFDGSNHLVAALSSMTRDGIGPRPLPSRVAAACRQLAHLGYWNRLWICQEVVLSAEIDLLLGPETIPWDTLATFWTTHGTSIIKASPGSFQGFQVITELIEARSGRSRGRMSWPDLIKLTAHRKCQEPSDRVYGLNGMVSPGLAVEVDYQRSPEDLFLLTIATASKDLPLAQWYSWFIYRSSTIEWRHYFTEAPSAAPVLPNLKTEEGYTGFASLLAQLWPALDRKHINTPLPSKYDIATVEGLLYIGRARERLAGVKWDGWRRPLEIPDLASYYGPLYVDAPGLHHSMNKDKLILRPSERARFGLPFRPYTAADRLDEQERYSRN